MSEERDIDWSPGKGSRPRTWNNKKFRNNFAQIDWSKKPKQQTKEKNIKDKL